MKHYKLLYIFFPNMPKHVVNIFPIYHSCGQPGSLMYSACHSSVTIGSGELWCCLHSFGFPVRYSYRIAPPGTALARYNLF